MADLPHEQNGRAHKSSARPPRSEGMWLAGLIAVAAAVVGVGVILIGAFFVSDEQGMPVPYEFEGRSCWQFGDDLLRCENKAYFVRDQGSWRQPGSCRPHGSSVLICARPYPLRIEADDSHVRLRREAETSS